MTWQCEHDDVAMQNVFARLGAPPSMLTRVLPTDQRDGLMVSGVGGDKYDQQILFSAACLDTVAVWMELLLVMLAGGHGIVAGGWSGC
mmetsp:Transcript_1825/g.2011  ORF Transcript_1825/g.2011 Transcript_1825/m.2011 type:complete len:88 (+) Transcript_1825:122-385(+)